VLRIHDVARGHTGIAPDAARRLLARLAVGTDTETVGGVGSEMFPEPRIQLRPRVYSMTRLRVRLAEVVLRRRGAGRLQRGKASNGTAARGITVEWKPSVGLLARHC
jgi:hypothetical protein